ncbi:MAG: DNA repair protein RecO C-terminal domain-containing protein, partial [Rhodococcus sp. (in: high G+C Gram-positive bacteria)]|uniref:DNA repair protein RecO n=1 Tax=Rhodococcus sp. TaxID=1831 RepID=UPI003BB66F50
GPHTAFHVAAGGAVCVHCRPPGAATPAPGVLDLMDALNHGRWDGTESIEPAVRSQASGLIAAHLQWHLERRLRTLAFVERSTDRAATDTAGAVGHGTDAVRQDEDRDSTTRPASIA